ncbi:MAG: hypothetical protein ABIG56_05865 [Candidatus Omnitrophota bacterium]
MRKSLVLVISLSLVCSLIIYPQINQVVAEEQSDRKEVVHFLEKLKSILSENKEKIFEKYTLFQIAQSKVDIGKMRSSSIEMAEVIEQTQRGIAALSVPVSCGRLYSLVIGLHQAQAEAYIAAANLDSEGSQERMKNLLEVNNAYKEELSRVTELYNVTIFD